MKIPKTFLFLITGLTLVLVCIIVLVLGNGGSEETVQREETVSETSEMVEKWQEGIVSHNGKTYRYNNSIKTYLIIGIDKEGVVKAAENYIQGGQSDAMFLLVSNASQEQLSVFSIHRNTMTRIRACYESGADAGYKTAQICIQHGYGDGMALSCTRVVEAVSYLFYNLPISGYLSLRMDAIPILNDMVGGVEVTVLEDVSYAEKNVELQAGETLTLSGDEAYAYLRTRDIGVFESATNRLRRQEQYIGAWIEKLKNTVAENPAATLSMYEALKPYIVSSIDFVSFATECKDYVYRKEDLYTIPGETVMGETYEEFYVDEDAFYEMLLDIFYTEI